MNGNPSKAQKDYHNDLRFNGCIVTGSQQVEIHHVFGSKFKAKIYDSNGDKIEKIGEWLVIPLHREVHLDIKSYDFKSERGLFLASCRRYSHIFDKACPVPVEVIEYYKFMKNRHDVPGLLDDSTI